jgi:allantoate deiminase
VRQQAISQLREYILQISAQRRAESGWKVLQETPAIACSLPQLEGLARAVTEVGQPVRYLPSGAGHDAVIMSEVTPVAMLFVRCKGGVSHNPAESVEVGDVAVAIEVMVRFLETLAQGDGA